MKAPLFEFPSYQYEVSDWDFKKKGLLNRINKSDFYRTELQTFETDRQTAGKTYVHYLQEFLRDILFEFCQEAKVTCGMTDAWCVRYQKGDQQNIHNHRGWGFSGVLYVEFDPKVHTPTCFVAPWQDPRHDTTSLAMPGTPIGKKSKKLFCKEENTEYNYHQIFFHYVLQDGRRAHCAWDRAR